MSRPILVVDIEATCWNDRDTTVHEMDVIEIGCALSADDGVVLDSFGVFVRPTLNPVLSRFCTELTTITQSDVDAALPFADAAGLIDEWLGRRVKGLVWGSWGNYDRNHLLVERERHGRGPGFLDVPHVNLKRLWAKSAGVRPMGMRRALLHAGFELDGTHHRGIDDARNICRLVPGVKRDLLNAAVDQSRSAIASR